MGANDQNQYRQAAHHGAIDTAVHIEPIVVLRWDGATEQEAGPEDRAGGLWLLRAPDWSGRLPMPEPIDGGQGDQDVWVMRPAGARVDQRSADVRAFDQGYIAAGGPAEVLTHMHHVIGDCESGWRDDRSAGYVSAAQFAPSTWAAMGGGDPSDLYTVGRNVATLINTIGVARAGTSAGWPVCWHVEGW